MTGGGGYLDNIGIDALVQLGAAGAITLVVLTYLKRNLDGVSRMPEMLLTYMREDGREMVEALKDTANALREAVQASQVHHAEVLDTVARQNIALERLTESVYTTAKRVQNVERMLEALVAQRPFQIAEEHSDQARASS